MNEEGQVACRCGQWLTRRCYVRALALYRSMSAQLGLSDSDSQRLERSVIEECGSLVLALCITHGRFSSPRPTQWSSGKINRVALVMEHPSGLQRATESCETGDVHLERTPTAGATPPRRILPDPSVRDRGRVPQWDKHPRSRGRGHQSDFVRLILLEIAVATFPL